MVKPPVSNQFPRVLQDTPIAARIQSSETIDYLAQHEIRYPERTNPYVALTFDCEMGTDSTRQILETLRQKDGREPPIRATFFIMGQYAYVYPDIIREIAADGHELGNHSYRHFRFTDLAPITATNEIVYTEAAVSWALGEHTPMRYFRFPYGEREQANLEHLALLGYQSVHWNLDPRGWESRKSQEDVVEYIRKTIRPGGIVVMHCGCWNDVNALPEIIRIVREAGLIPGTISDIEENVPPSIPPGGGEVSVPVWARYSP
jgi:peptidoglycan/xylan/chitin deacetylase (PgdA/CDA1 family)